MDDHGMDYMEDGMGMDYNNNMLPVFKGEDENLRKAKRGRL